MLYKNTNTYRPMRFDGYAFSEAGIRGGENEKGMYLWHFTIMNYTKNDSLIKQGEHKIKVCFPGGKQTNEFKIQFVNNPPDLTLEMSSIDSKTKKIKGEARTKTQIPENEIKVELEFYYEDSEESQISIPVKKIVYQDTGKLQFEFEISLENFPSISKEDQRYTEMFFAVIVSDKAGNRTYYQETYNQYIAVGTKFFGSSNAQLKIDREYDDSNQTVNSRYLIKPMKPLNQTHHKESLIILNVESRIVNRKSLRRLNWESNISEPKPRALIFRDGKQIGMSETNSYSDTQDLTQKTVFYHIEIEDKFGKTHKSNTEAFTKLVNRPKMITQTNPCLSVNDQWKNFILQDPFLNKAKYLFPFEKPQVNNTSTYKIIFQTVTYSDYVNFYNKLYEFKNKYQENNDCQMMKYKKFFSNCKDWKTFFDTLIEDSTKRVDEIKSVIIQIKPGFETTVEKKVKVSISSLIKSFYEQLHNKEKGAFKNFLLRYFSNLIIDDDKIDKCFSLTKLFSSYKTHNGVQLQEFYFSSWFTDVLITDKDHANVLKMRRIDKFRTIKLPITNYQYQIILKKETDENFECQFLNLTKTLEGSGQFVFIAFFYSGINKKQNKSNVELNFKYNNVSVLLRLHMKLAGKVKQIPDIINIPQF